MVYAGRMLFRIPESETWYDNLDQIKCKPEQPIEVKELSTNNCRGKTLLGKKIGKIPYDLAKMKYASV